MDIQTTQAITISLRAGTLMSRLLLTVAIARWLPPSDLGQFGLITAALAFILLALGMEFYSFSMRELMKAPNHSQVQMLRDNLALFLGGYAALILFASIVLALRLAPGSLIACLVALAIAEHLSHEITRSMVALGRPVVANLVLFVRVAAWIYALILYKVATHAEISLEFVLRWWLGGAILSLIIATLVLHSMPWYSLRGKSINWHWVATGLQAARPFLITASCALGLSYVDRFILNSAVGPAAVGVLTFYSGVATSSHTLINASVSTVRLPRLVTAWDRGDANWYLRESQSLLRNILIWVAPLTFFCAIAIYPFTDWLDREEYREHLSAYQIILLAAAIRCIADAPIYGLYSQHRDRELLRVNLSAFATSLLANLILVPHLGVFGCALSALLGSTVLASAAWMRLRHAASQPAA